MTADERLALIRVKVERAKEHIRELESENRSFLSTNPYAIGTKRDLQTRRLIYYVTSVSETPTGIASLAGDAIQNLRSALDHLAYQLVIVGTGQPPSTPTYFPIASNATKYPAQRNSQTKGMRPDAAHAIDALMPYKGGNDTLWLIHRLNIIDKHRALLTVGSAYRSVNIGALLTQQLQQGISSDPAHSGVIIPTLELFIQPADRLFPLKVGDELFIDGPDAEPNAKLQFRFEVAVGEPEIPEGRPLVEMLQQMADVVDNLVISFKPQLS